MNSNYYYEIYYAYDFKFTTGNAPKGLFKVNDKNYKLYKNVLKDFKLYIDNRLKDAEFEWGWDKEFRLSILKNNNNKLSLILSDKNDNFWKNLIN